MLVLNRKAGERIWIGPEMELIVMGIHNGRVKLGFEGPPEISIHRDEVVRRSKPVAAIPSPETKPQGVA